MNIRNKRGPNIEPCGIPHYIWLLNQLNLKWSSDSFQFVTFQYFPPVQVLKQMVSFSDSSVSYMCVSTFFKILLTKSINQTSFCPPTHLNVFPAHDVNESEPA